MRMSGERRTVNSADTQRDIVSTADTSLEPVQKLQENANSDDVKYESAVELTTLRNRDIFLLLTASGTCHACSM